MQKLLWISELTLLPAFITALGKVVEVLHVKPKNGFTNLIKSLTEPQDLIVGNSRYVDGGTTSYDVRFVVNKSIKDILDEIVLPSLASNEPFTCVSTMLEDDLKDELFDYLSGTSLPVIKITNRRVHKPDGVYDGWEFSGWVEIVQPVVTKPFPSQS